MNSDKFIHLHINHCNQNIEHFYQPKNTPSYPFCPTQAPAATDLTFVPGASCPRRMSYTWNDMAGTLWVWLFSRVMVHAARTTLRFPVIHFFSLLRSIPRVAAPHSSPDERLSCFQFGQRWINHCTHWHTYIWCGRRFSFLSDTIQPGGVLDQVVSVCLTLWKRMHCFCEVMAPFLHPCQDLISSSFFFSHFNRLTMISHYGFNLYFPNA